MFSYGGYVKDHVFVLPLPRNLAQLRERIVHAVLGIDRHMFGRLWEELDYRIDVRHVTNSGHMEYL